MAHLSTASRVFMLGEVHDGTLNTARCMFMLGDVHDGTLEHSKPCVYVR